jgi:hypothetical protein
MGLFGGSNARGRVNESFGIFNQDMDRQKSLNDSEYADLLGFSNKQKAPELSGDMDSYLKALANYGNTEGIANDNLMQGERSNLFNEGEKAQEGTEQLSLANNNSGGFSNQGSTDSMLTKLHAKLSEIAENSKNQRNAVVAKAGDWRQRFADSQREFGNNQALQQQQFDMSRVAKNMDLATKKAQGHVERASQLEAVNQRSKQMFVGLMADLAKAGVAVASQGASLAVPGGAPEGKWASRGDEKIGAY